MPRNIDATATTPSATPDASQAGAQDPKAAATTPEAQPEEAYSAADALREIREADEATKAGGEKGQESDKKPDADKGEPADKKAESKADDQTGKGTESTDGPDPKGSPGEEAEPKFPEEAKTANAKPEEKPAGEGEPRYKLDEAVEKALTEHAPKELERLQQQIKGLEKRETQIAHIEKDVPRYKSLDAAEAAFDDPQQCRPAIAQLLEFVATRQETTVDSLMDDLDEIFAKRSEKGDQPGRQRPAAGPDPEVAQLREQLTDVQGKLSALLTDKEQTQKSKDDEAYFAKVTPGTIGWLGKQYPGFNVTPEMVRDAITALPQYRESPATAVRKFFGEEIGKHIAEQAGKRPEAPEHVSSSGTSKSGRVVDPEEYTAADAYADIHRH
jgi:hypothetical protein